MKAALDRLKVTDPATYDMYMNGMIKRGSGFTAEMVMTSMQKAWLQWCLQEAITAKGTWAFYVGKTPITGYFAEIHTKGAPSKGSEIVTRTDYDSPAAALLAAYIAASEATCQKK